MTFGAPLARIAFPAIDRPSAGFVTRFERAIRAYVPPPIDAPFAFDLSGAVEAVFDDCLASIGPTTHHIVVGVGAGHGLISIPDAILPMLLEYAYGGDGSDPCPIPAAPTPLAVRFGYRVAAMLVECLRAALPGADVSLLGATDVPGEAVGLKHMALACGFEIRAGEAAIGAVGLCVGLRTLADIETAAGGPVADPDWAIRLDQAIGNTRLSVRCIVARPTLSAGDVAQLAPGSVIPINDIDEVTLIAGGYRIATGVADVRDGRAVVIINRTEFNS